MRPEHFQEDLLKMTQIGIALSGEHSLNQLLEMIITEARSFFDADAGSIYLREGDKLLFAVSQNQTLQLRLGPEGERSLFTPFTIPVDVTSIAGYVALSKQNLNLPDVYCLPAEAPYSFNREFDSRNDYRTQAMLTVPMKDHHGAVLGVLQLINPMQDGMVIPFSGEQEELVRSLASLAAVSVNNARLTEQIKRVHLDTIYRLSVAAEYKDEDTAQHIRRISRYSAALARQIGWPEAEVELLLYAAPMHDIGKIGVPDAILTKPGKLTDEERLIMQEHTHIGARIMSGSDSDVLKLGEVVAFTHHEKWNGKGYPRGRQGEDIPLAGRIVALVDAFDALTTKRVYKLAVDPDLAFQRLEPDAGTHFDPVVFQAFTDIFPLILAIREEHKD